MGGMDGYRGGGCHLQTIIFYFFVREKAKNTGKTQGILSCSERGNLVITEIDLFMTLACAVS